MGKKQLDDLRPVRMIPTLVPQARVTILSEVSDYNHELMNIPSMWRETRGKGVKIAILDTGLPEHNDITPAGSKSFITGYLKDLNGHATFTGGILCAVADNGMGVRGIAPDAEDYYAAVLDRNGSGSVNAINSAIHWAVDEIGADIINMSLGIARSAFANPSGLEYACNYAYDHGVTLFAAAGNGGGQVDFPACYDSVISVGAINDTMCKANFSAFGPEVDFVAGGVDVYSTWKRNGYASLSGTSFSCPAVAGVGALIIAKARAKGEKLTPGEVKDKLRKISYDLGPEGRDDVFGYGLPVFAGGSDPDPDDVLAAQDEGADPEAPGGRPLVASWWHRFLRSLRG